MNIAIDYIKHLKQLTDGNKIYSNIKQHLKGKLKTAFGYKWKIYVKESIL